MRKRGAWHIRSIDELSLQQCTLNQSDSWRFPHARRAEEFRHWRKWRDRHSFPPMCRGEARKTRSGMVVARSIFFFFDLFLLIARFLLVSSQAGNTSRGVRVPPEKQGFPLPGSGIEIGLACQDWMKGLDERTG